MLNDQALTGVVCCFDPELEMNAQEIADYVGDRDEKQLRAKAGGRPTKFFIRRLDHKTLAYVRAAANEDDQRMRAFRCAVIKVENLRERDTRDMLMPVWEPQRIMESSKLATLEAVTEAEAERFEYAEIQEIGGVALHRSFFPKWTGAKCPLLHSSQQMWMAEIVRRAGLEAASARDGQHASLSESPSTSGVHGDVTATEPVTSS